MKTLVIWNSISSQTLKRTLAADFKTENEESDFNMVTSLMEWEEFDINSYNPKHILILVELNWKNENFEGYEIALEIMKKWKLEKAPWIRFASFISREQLYNLTTGKGLFRVFVKSFTHDLLPNELKVTNEQFSLARWNYLKKYMLTQSGILDKLHHDLRNYLNNPDRISQKEVHHFLQQVEEINDITGKEINDFLLSFSKSDPSPVDKLSRLNTLIGKRMVQLTEEQSNKTQILSTRSKYKILLLEDNKIMLEQLKTMFEPYFEVSDFYDGMEALTELKVGGQFYHAICIDLELLDETYRFDQEVQGVEVLEFSRKDLPHIARRVITGIGRKGVKELLPDMENQDIILKSHLELFGRDETFVEFIGKLNSDIKKQSILLEMKGPEGTFWSDFSRQGNKEGGKLKRYYYEIKLDEIVFNNLWSDVHELTRKMLDGKDIMIPCSFEKTINAKEIVKKADNEKKIDFLRQLLIHRLYWISKFKNNDSIIYKDELNKENSFFHLPFWDGKLFYNPKQYFLYLGFGCPKLYPQSPKKEDNKVTFNFKYKKLFPEEIDYLKSRQELFEDKISDFYFQNVKFCDCLDTILFYIMEDQKNSSDRTQFKKFYKRKDNTIEITEAFSKNTLKLISSENIPRNKSNTWETAYSLLNSFAITEEVGVEEIDDWTNDFYKLPSEIRNYIIKIINQ